VVIEHGGGGSKSAAPVARDVLREVQRRHNSSRLVAGKPATHIAKAGTR
jgi:cell division protein FtsI/penicillin-binding protein 2